MGYMSGPVSVQEFDVCDGAGLQGCNTKKNIIVNVVDGQEVGIDLVDVKTVDPDGKPITLQDTVHVRIYRQDYDVAIEIRIGYDYLQTVSVSPSMPVLYWDYDIFPVRLLARLYTDSLLSLEISGGELKLMMAESSACFCSSPSTPSAPWIEHEAGSSEATLKVNVTNIGDIKADSVVTVECDGIEPVVAQSKTLEFQETALLTFNLLSTGGPISSSNQCHVSLKSVAGTVWQSANITP